MDLLVACTQSPLATAQCIKIVDCLPVDTTTVQNVWNKETLSASRHRVSAREILPDCRCVVVVMATELTRRYTENEIEDEFN